MQNNLFRNDSVVAKRMGSFIVDHFLFSMLIVPPFVLKNVHIGDYSAFMRTLYTIMLIAFCVYLLKDAIGGRSPGKLLFGIAVRDVENPEKTPPLHRLVLRNLFLPIWPVELILLISSKDGRRLGDRVAKTCVVTTRTNEALKSNASYQAALRYIQTQEAVISQVEEITGFDALPSSSMDYTNGFATVDYRIKVSGTTGSMVIAIRLEKASNSDWAVANIEYLN